jgi:hypothetical protein
MRGRSTVTWNLFGVVVLIVAVTSAATLSAADSHGTLANGLGWYKAGAQLSNAPSYEWWYGCSPTAAGMNTDKTRRPLLQSGLFIVYGVCSSSAERSRGGTNKKSVVVFWLT